MMQLELYRTTVKYSSNNFKEIKLFEKGMRVFIQGAVFSKSYKENKWDGYIRFCNLEQKTFPIGLLFMAKNILYDEEIEFSEKNFIKPFIYKEKKNPMLYEHQIAAIDEYFKWKHGIIKVPTRGGKTFIAAEIIRLIHSVNPTYPVLFVVDTSLLLEQAIADFANYFSVKKSQIGFIQGDEYNPKLITICTIQTLQSRITGSIKKLRNNKKLDSKELRLRMKQARVERGKFLNFLSTIKFRIVDEIQEYTSDERISVLEKCNNIEMDLCLSATPFKSEDEVGNLTLRKFSGDVIYTIEDKILKERGVLSTDKIFLLSIDHNKNKNIEIVSDRPYASYRKQIITHNPLRNQILLNVVEILRKLKVKTLVLFSDLSHGEYIQSITSDVFINGNMKMTDRTKFLKDFMRRKGGVLLASNVFNKGITLPEVSVLVNAGGGLEQSNVTQKKGRVLGVTKDKKKALTLDFIDNYEYFSEHSLSRIEVYEESVGIKNIEVFDTQDNEMYLDLREFIIEWLELDV